MSAGGASDDPPDTIRIGDLAHPVLSERQRAVLEAVSRIEVVLSRDAVLGAAQKQTGLSDFGADDFRERLDVWLASVEEDETLGPVGRLGVFGDCVRYASNRLRLEDRIRQHPEILELELARPIIIAGLPRSGTTHLLNLIADDTRLRSLPYWESLEPISVPGEEPAPDGSDPRLVRCRQNFERQDGLLPHLRAMHHMTPEHVHEEIELQAIDFSSYILEWIAEVPRWRDYYLAHDQTPHYAYMRKALQAVQWQRGGDRWILKSPQHLEQLGPLLQTFPDATVVFTHRDPVAVIRSAITMNAYGARVRCKRVDIDGIAAYWIDRVERMLRACVRDRDAIPEGQSLDVLFHEFMADDIATVERIYRLAGLEMTHAARAALGSFMTRNPRGKYGRVVYDLKADFGVDPGELRERFDFYFERFPIRAE
jgi:hypothetical protein